MVSATRPGLIGMAVWMALGQSAAFAQGTARGTDAEREACTPDAFRLCMMAMPDAGRVEDCLRRAGPRLSQACYAVFFPPLPPQAQFNQQRPLRQQAPSLRSQMPPPRPPVDDDD